MPSPIYLDANATTAPLPEVLEEVTRVSKEAFGNPGSQHHFGRQARRELERARESIAEILTAHPDEVVFTSGGTESSNLALLGLAMRSDGKVATPSGEHPATSESVLDLQSRGWSHVAMPVDSEGRLDRPLPLLEAQNPNLVSVLLAHNETGVIQKLSDLSAWCEQNRIPLHVDGVQAVGKIPVSFHGLKATTLSLGAHKFHGPRGVGALLVRRGVTLPSRNFGGHQEAGLRPGTEPVPLIAGMAKALEVWHSDQQQITAHITKLRDRLETGLLEHCSPARIHGAHKGAAGHSEESQSHRLPNTCSVAFPGLSGESLLVALDLDGIACSLGSTCASGSAEPAPILLAMGVPRDVALATIRLSVNRHNTIEEIDSAVERIAKQVKKLRAV